MKLKSFTIKNLKRKLIIYYDRLNGLDFSTILKSERELIIIYNNPTCHEEVIRQGIFIKIGSYPDQWGNGISIYSNKGFKSSRLLTNKF